MEQQRNADIALRPVQRAEHAQHAKYEAPYRSFIAASLVLGIGGGFMLALLLPLARALEWEWGSGRRWDALVQAHGQLQLLGFAGLFVIGMSFRLMPRFSTRDLAFPHLVPALIPLIGSSVILRSFAQPWSEGAVRDTGLIVSAVLMVAAAAVLAVIIGVTLIHRESKADVTGEFFVAGTVGFAVAAVINLMQVIEIARDDVWLGPSTRQSALLFIEQWGFVLMFIGGVSMRAVPTLTGNPRRITVSRGAGALLAGGTALFAGAMLWVYYREGSETTARTADIGLLMTAAAFVLLAWGSGALTPAANRVAAASQTQFWFVRSTFAWFVVAGGLTAWYAAGAFSEGRGIDQFEMDAIRHTLTIGVIAMMIIGMSLLIVPEFAGRRLQHPNEKPLIIAMLIALNVSVFLRIWPAAHGIDWLESTRYWPMAISGALAATVLIVFAAMFAQSYVEQRKPNWASPAALAGRADKRPG